MPIREFNFIHSRSELSRRLSKHANGSGHILACEKLAKESDQNSKLENKSDEIEVKVEMHDSGDENNRLEEERILSYIGKLKPKFQWLQLSEGKLFCKVRNMKIISQNFYFTLHAISSNSKLLGKLG